MKRVYIFAVVSLMLMLMVVLPSWASINLNSSRSNVYRLVWANNVGLSQAQATTMLAELDKLGPADEGKLKQWLPANFKRFGIQETRVKQVSIFLEQPVSCTSAVQAC